MKRVIVIAVCFFVLYAGAVWALAGCLALGEAMASGQRSDSHSSNPHRHDGDSHHSHSDSAEVHCPNPLAAFVSAQRVSLERERGWTANLAGVEIQVRSLSNGLTHHNFALGPPGLGFPTTPQRFLLLSVIRV
jgi:hypothetical protein